MTAFFLFGELCYSKIVDSDLQAYVSGDIELLLFKERMTPGISEGTV